MNALYYAAGTFVASAPFLAIIVIVLHYHLRRAAWKRALRAGRKPVGFCPSPSAFGSAFQIIQVFYRPNVAHVIEAKQEEDVDEDDNGDPEPPARLFHRQLKRIRRGERIDRLILRL
jgi:hypothetical protein